MPQTTLWQRLIRWVFPASAGKHHQASHIANPPSHRESARQQRAEQRHKLHAVVRENMIRAGVLSGAYKFKTLPLDRAGQSFIVLFDIDAMAGDALHQAELEMSLQALAQERLGIDIKSVYWRTRIAQAPAPSSGVTHPQAHTHRPDFAPTQPFDHDPGKEALYPSHTQPGRLE